MGFFKGSAERKREQRDALRVYAHSVANASPNAAHHDQDADDWALHYPPALVQWLYGVLRSVEWRMTPLQILETEQAFPGLIEDLARIQWLVARATPQEVTVDGKTYKEQA